MSDGVNGVVLYGPNGERMNGRQHPTSNVQHPTSNGDPLGGRRGRVEAGPLRAKAWSYSAYEAADRRDFSGYFYFPQLSAAEQLNDLTLAALWERSDWLYANVPAVRMAIDGLALTEVGTGLWPKWMSSGDEFNKAMTDAFHYANHDPRVFSADGSMDFYTAQFNIRRMIRKSGDCFGQLLRPAEGSLHPQLSLIPAYRVANSGDATKDKGWVNGVLANPLGRPVAYRVTKEGGKGFDDIPAEDMLHFFDPMLPGQKRGEPALACVAKKLFRREDIAKAIANGTLARERMGFAIEETDNSGMSGFRNNSGVDLAGEGEESLEENEDGSTYSLQKFFGPNSSDQIQIPKLPANLTIKTLESNRPGTQVMEYQDSILKELAWATLYPAEFIFFLGGMGQGTVARLVLQKARAIVLAKRQWQLIPQFCNRWWTFDAWQLIKGGVVKGPVPRDWWKTKVNADADMSVDLGREGSLYDRRVAANRMSIEGYHAMAGEDASDVEDENLGVIRRRLKKLAQLNKDAEGSGETFTYSDIWPRETTFQVATAAPGDGGQQQGGANE